MSVKNSLIILWFTVLSCTANGQSSIKVTIPSVETEAEYVWNTLRDMPFFDQNHYEVSLPKGALIDRLVKDARAGELKETDFEALQAFMRDSVYQTADYQKGYDQIQQEMPMLQQMVNTLDTMNFDWHFTHFDTYEVVLTLYGPGGSYNNETGTVLLYTTVDGGFKNYTYPAYTIIHEIVHIGIETPLITKYNVPHALKERIVDTFVWLSFGEALPNYQIQDMGDKRLDQYVKVQSDLKQLDHYLNSIMHEK